MTRARSRRATPRSPTSSARARSSSRPTRPTSTTPSPAPDSRSCCAAGASAKPAARSSAGSRRSCNSKPSTTSFTTMTPSRPADFAMSFRSVRTSLAGRGAARAGGVLLSLGALLQACSSGSGGSDVGGHTAVTPTARVQVLNGAANRTFREGAEVLLTGKASEDSDGPPIAWSWRQTSGPTVRLLETNSTTVKFTAPHVAAPTVLAFELTVMDSTGNAGSASTDITVLPSRDSDKFLSLDVARGLSFDTFEVVAALAGEAN